MAIIEENFSLADKNTFGIKAKCKKYIGFYNDEELLPLLDSDLGSELFILGGGSNILITCDYPGTIIQPLNKDITIVSKDDEHVIIEAGAAVNWDDFVDYCVSRGYYGLEKLSYIPGSVGASPVQNIGAYGAEVMDYIYAVRGINIKDKTKFDFNNRECKFEYRKSIFKTNDHKSKIITSVVFKLDRKTDFHRADIRKIFVGYLKIAMMILESIRIVNFKLKARNDISTIVRKIMKIGCLSPYLVRKLIIYVRKKTLPDVTQIGNVGSFFKSPVLSLENFELMKKEWVDVVCYSYKSSEVKISAGWLIDKCGWRGKILGDVMIHTRRPIIIMNRKNATGQEILKVATMIEESVRRKFNIILEKEVVVLPT